MRLNLVLNVSPQCANRHTNMMLPVSGLTDGVRLDCNTELNVGEDDPEPAEVADAEADAGAADATDGDVGREVAAVATEAAAVTVAAKESPLVERCLVLTVVAPIDALALSSSCCCFIFCRSAACATDVDPFDAA